MCKKSPDEKFSPPRVGGEGYKIKGFKQRKTAIRKNAGEVLVGHSRLLALVAEVRSDILVFFQDFTFSIK